MQSQELLDKKSMLQKKHRDMIDKNRKNIKNWRQPKGLRIETQLAFWLMGSYEKSRFGNEIAFCKFMSYKH